MVTLKEDIKVSLDHCTVTEFKAGEYETLPEAAMVFAGAHGLIEESDPEAEAKAAAEKAEAEAKAATPAPAKTKATKSTK